MRSIMGALAALALMAGSAQAQTWDAAPWLADVAQMRAAFATKYANREWLEQERGIALTPAFDMIAARVARAGSDAEARAILDRFIRQIGDGHVALRWPAPARTGAAEPAPTPAPTPASLCAKLGYRGVPSDGVAVKLPGYAPLPNNPGVLPAGIASIGAQRIGVVRIAFFAPHAYPQLCVDAVAALRVPVDQPCDESCDNRIITHAYAALTAGYQASLRRLRAERAQALLVDLTGNGGGSEWAEAAARSLTTQQFRSASLGFVRGPHWAAQWQRVAETLRNHAGASRGAERNRLLALAAQADAARIQADTPCAPGGTCSWLGRAGYATGLIGSAAPGEFLGSAWGAHVFSAGQHDFRPGSWDGPLMVLVDQETWSAAEQFTALLQDAGAATVVGARTGGAGCGYTYGGTPTTLTHSGATLLLPDCVRFRADGSNEVAGIVPDIPIGWRANDAVPFRLNLLQAALPAAVAHADARYRSR